jgi:hypothetical protein
MTPAEIPLTLSADVLRVPINMNARAVLAEIVSLHAATGRCDASDSHFSARLTINRDTVSVAVKLLEAEGLIKKVTTRLPTGFYRTLAPLVAAIAAKAAANPYPEIPATPTRKNRVALPGNSGLAYPEKPVALPGNSGSNTPLNTTTTFHLPDDAATAAAPVEVEQVVASVEKPGAQASHTEGGAADVATSITKRRLLMRNSPVASLAAFTEYWAAAAQTNPDTYAPYESADLQHYHTALLDWSNAEGKTKFDWLGTIRNSMRRDAEQGRLHQAGKPFTSKPSPSHAANSAFSKPGTARHHVPAVTSYGKLLAPSSRPPCYGPVSKPSGSASKMRSTPTM